MIAKRLLLALGFFCITNEAYSQSFNPIPRNQRPAQSPSVVLPRSFTRGTVQSAFDQANEIIQARRTQITSRRRPMDPRTNAPSMRHFIFQGSKPRARRLESVQEKFEEATRILLNELNLTPEQIQQGLAQADLQNMLTDNSVQECRALFNVTNCMGRDRYRTFDGTCNNLNHPSWGMASSCFQRLMDAFYSDGTAAKRLAISGRPLPEPRTISLEIHSHIDNPTDYVTHVLMQWGQFLDHDISLSPLSQGENNQPLNCCPVEENDPPQCDPLMVESDDPFFSNFGVTCLNNARTVMCSTCALGPRQQTNQLTAFIDASQIYGISLNDSRALRTLDGSGMLRSVRNSNSGELLPESADPANDGCSFQERNLNCFAAGDVRVNQHPALTSFHTIFLREHNRIARRLRQINSRWDDERIYQEARRIVGAQMQMITYNEFLPLVIGPERMEWFDLSIHRNGDYTAYDETVDPTLLNEFSTAAFRFGHSMVNSFFTESARNGQDSGNRLRDIFLYPFGLYNGQLERMMLGLTQSPAQKFDRYVVRDLTNHLYQMRGNQTGLDLASLNVNRGRDHGIPPYTSLVRFCGGPEIRNFRSLDRLFQRGLSRLLQGVYENVGDIDLFTGGLSERPNQGAIVGPTFTCVIGIQFYHLKYGDRFYFEHGGQTGSFSQDQLREIRKTRFSKIICDNSEIDSIQQNVMMYQSNRNPIVPCNQLEEMNLDYWRE